MVLVLDSEPLEGDDSESILVAPLHRDGALAGPEDVLLPREVFGYRMVVCVGASFPTLPECLELCLGQLPEDWLNRLQLFSDWLTGVTEERPDVLVGLPYLDEQDVRWRFKNKMMTDLAYLQFPVVDWMVGSGLLDDSQAGDIATNESMGRLLCLPFGDEIEDLALAADSSISAERPLASRVYRAADPDVGVIIQISEAEDAGYLSLEVLEDVQNITEGAVLLSEDGNANGHIMQGMAYFVAPKTGRFLVRLADGRDVAFLDITTDREGNVSDGLDT